MQEHLKKIFICTNNTFVKWFIIFNLLYLFISFYAYENVFHKTPKKLWIWSNKLKFVLHWTETLNMTKRFQKPRGQSIFLDRKCPVNNCFLTSEKRLLKNIEDFDVILFNIPFMQHSFHSKKLPQSRSLSQKYVFVSSKSSKIFKLSDKKYNGFFNWTWTYKFNSDIDFRYIIVRNKAGDVIGPKNNMNWLEFNDMQSTDNETINKLKNKSIAAAWFVSSCNKCLKVNEVVAELQEELTKYNMTLDIYGDCGNKQCPKENATYCFKKIERDYYFYLSFENSVCEEYVTEKLLNAVQHYAVPVVFGGANYTNFMPDGTYLNIRTLGAKGVAKTMFDSINNKELYYSFFRWHNHYSYHDSFESPDTDPYCNLCKAINNYSLMKKVTIYENIVKWWNI